MSEEHREVSVLQGRKEVKYSRTTAEAVRIFLALAVALLLPQIMIGEDLPRGEVERAVKKPWNLHKLMLKYEGAVMDQVIIKVLSKSKDVDEYMDSLQGYLDKRSAKDRNKLIQGISKASLPAGLRLMGKMEGMDAINTILKHIKSKDDDVQLAAVMALQDLPWSKEHEKIMLALSKKIAPLFDIEDWRAARGISKLLDRWNELEFPVEALYEMRLKGESSEGKRNALVNLVQIRGWDSVSVLAVMVKERDLWHTISRQLPILLNIEERSKKQFDLLMKVILSLLNEEDFELHHRVVSDLGRAEPSEDIAKILCGLLDLEYGEEIVHHTAVLLQTFAKEIDMQKLLENRFENRKWSFKAAVLLAMGYLDEEWCSPLILRGLKERREEVLIAAAETVSRLSGPGAKVREDYIDALLPKVQTKSPALGLSAAHALGRLGEPRVLAPLAPLLKKKESMLPAMALAEALVGPWGKDPFSLAKEFQSQKDPLPTLRPVPPPSKNSHLVFYELQAECPSVIFIIDTSSSMLKDGRWEQAKEQLYSCLFGLEMDTLVNIIDYNTKVRRWKDYPVRATWRNKLDFFQHVEKLRPRGKTNIHDALTIGMRQWSRDTLFFLTDGMPTEGVTSTRNIEREVESLNRNGHVRLFCVGLQVKDAHRFLTNLSENNGGAVRMID